MLHKNKFLTMLMLAALLISACQPLLPEGTQSGAVTSKLSDKNVAEIREIVETRMAKNQIPGFAVAVVQNGEMIYAEGFGIAEMDTDRPITPRTVFQLASTSKPLTAIAIMQLVEAGKLHLDAHVTDYLPYFKLADERYRDITIAQILTHRSGLPEGGGFLGGEGLAVEMDAGAAERYVRSLADLQLLFAPGEDWAYSDMGYNVLGDVIAKASGQLFEDYVQEHIFTPLGMTQTTFLLSDVPTTALALPHMLNAAGKMGKVEEMPYTRAFAPSDTLYSSVAMSRLARKALITVNWMGSASCLRKVGSRCGRYRRQPGLAICWTTWRGLCLWLVLGTGGRSSRGASCGTEVGYQNIFLLALTMIWPSSPWGNALGPDEDSLCL
ncbi:MAG: serine hydrolase domain-containing protein [Caldilineaceae bacterium]